MLTPMKVEEGEELSATLGYISLCLFACLLLYWVDCLGFLFCFCFR